jgi:hypothetical protein
MRTRPFCAPHQTISDAGMVVANFADLLDG